MTTENAENLFAVSKKLIKNLADYNLIPNKIDKKIELENLEFDKKFFIDILGYNEIEYRFQHRYDTIVLRRIDFGRTPHKNPIKEFKGYPVPNFLKSAIKTTLREPHVHFYVEGYDDGFALPMAVLKESNLFFPDFEKSLVNFLDYCNIKAVKTVQLSMFGGGTK